MNDIDYDVQMHVVHQMIREAIERGQHKVALRLANKYSIPNAIRRNLGVELSSNPRDAPGLEVG